MQNPRIVNFGEDFADTLVVIVRQQDAPSLQLSNPQPGQRRMRRITFHPIQANRDLIDISVPLVFGSKIGPGRCIWTVTCQNQGTGVDQFVRVELKSEQSAIIDLDIPNPNQVQLVRGGKPGSSVATFMIRTLLPREAQFVRLLAKDNISLSASLWTQNSGDSDAVFIYDADIGPEEGAT